MKEVELKQRIEEIDKKINSLSKKENFFHQSTSLSNKIKNKDFLHIITEIFSFLVTGFFIGYLFDKFFNFSPFCLLSGMILSVLACIRNIMNMKL